MSRLILILTLLIWCACNSGNSKKDDKASLILNKTALKKVRLLGHKGSGDSPFGFKDFLANSKKSVQYAISMLDGSEIDLQLSQDHTLWLFHDHEIFDCSNNLINFYEATDSLIEEASRCNYRSQLIKLSAFISSFEASFKEEKTISLDLKLLLNTPLIESMGGVETVTDSVIKKISYLKDIEQLDLLIEVPTYSSLERFQKNGFECYKVVSSPEEEVSDSSFNYSYSLSRLLNFTHFEAPGKKKQIWTINNFEELKAALLFNPSYIQGDNVSLLAFVDKWKNEALKFSQIELIQRLAADQGQEYLDVTELSLKDIEEQVLVRVKMTQIPKKNDNLLLVISSKNNKGENVFWDGLKIRDRKFDYFKYIDRDKMLEKDCKVLKIFIWNQQKRALDFSSLFVDLISISN